MACQPVARTVYAGPLWNGSCWPVLSKDFSPLRISLQPPPAPLDSLSPRSPRPAWRWIPMPPQDTASTPAPRSPTPSPACPHPG
jgi:hypothetical protein